ncbi:MAG: transglutaminase-like domain-containing protein [Coriobacteriales bacterium]|jgi:hypothetical protein|nr:transglutaminase-like domain-containing protein [Coriobacteriales bacterium]
MLKLPKHSNQYTRVSQTLQLLLLLLLVWLLGVLLSGCGSNGIDLGGSLGGSSGSSNGSTNGSKAIGEDVVPLGPARDNTPQVLVAEQPGVAVAGDGSAALDYSNASEGYICAASYAGDVKVKALVNAPDGAQYQYTLDPSGAWITIPLSVGSGNYVVQLFQNVYADQYAALFAQDVYAEITNEFGAFLYPNQYVDFDPDDQTVLLSQQLAEGATSEVQAVDQIYLWTVQNISYDYDKAANVAPGYLPDNDDTLASKDGICFDYAVLMASMCRAQRLPAKLDIGYAGSAYHAWIHVYTAESGWTTREIEFPGNSWVLMDPTFDSAGQGKGNIESIVGDGSNYQTVFNY